MINRRRSGARGTPAKVNATAGLEASEGVNSASVSDGSHESRTFVLLGTVRSGRRVVAEQSGCRPLFRAQIHSFQLLL